MRFILLATMVLALSACTLDKTLVIETPNDSNRLAVMCYLGVVYDIHEGGTYKAVFESNRRPKRCLRSPMSIEDYRENNRWLKKGRTIESTKYRGLVNS